MGREFFSPVFGHIGSWNLSFYAHVSFAGVLDTILVPRFLWSMTPSVSRFSIVIDTFLKVLTSFYLECSRLTSLAAKHQNGDPTPGACRCTHYYWFLFVCPSLGGWDYRHLLQ